MELREGYCHRTTTSVNSVLATVKQGESALSEWGSASQAQLTEAGTALDALGSEHTKELAGINFEQLNYHIEDQCGRPILL